MATKAKRTRNGLSNKGKKKCPTCFKMFSPDEIESHLKVHYTETHLQNDITKKDQNDDIRDEKIYNLKHQVRVLRSLLGSLNRVVGQLIDLEEF